MDIPGPAADDDEWSDDEFSGYVDTNQQRGETESGVNRVKGRSFPCMGVRS